MYCGSIGNFSFPADFCLLLNLSDVTYSSDCRKDIEKAFRRIPGLPIEGHICTYVMEITNKHIQAGI